MTRTRNGVYYDLTKSAYKFKPPGSNNTFIFSSDLHLVKFQEQYLLHREEFNRKMYARYRLMVEFTVLADIVLYVKIETRGFLIISGEGEKLWQENLILNGEQAMRKN